MSRLMTSQCPLCYWTAPSPGFVGLCPNCQHDTIEIIRAVRFPPVSRQVAEQHPPAAPTAAPTEPRKPLLRVWRTISFGFVIAAAAASWKLRKGWENWIAPIRHQWRDRA